MQNNPRQTNNGSKTIINFKTKLSAKNSKILAILLLFIISAVSANAAVTVDNTSSDRDSAVLGLSSMTWAHTVGTGSEKALYVGVSSATTLLPVSLAPSLLSVAAVTYNGVPMTRVGSVQSAPIPLLGSLVSKSYVDVYRLVNPPSGTHNVAVNFSTLGIVALDVFVNQAVGGAISYNGVDQTTPNSFFASNSGTSNSPNLTVNGGTTQDLIMDVLASSPNAKSFTPSADQTLRWEGNFPQVLTVSPYDLGAGSTKAGGSSVSMNWTLETGNGWALGGLAVRAASNPPSVFTVNTNLDNESDGCAVNNCTLREAINDANNTAQPDTINFAPAVTGVITLTQGQLTAYSDMTINGPGARNLIVSGGGNSRVFLIGSALLSGDITVNINGLTIANGNAQPVLIGSTLIGDGGGILNGALLGILSGTSTLNLTEVNVSNNRATTLGGGIATRLGARTNISRSLISRNVSNATLPIGIVAGDVGGGGISNIAGTTSVSNSTVSDNSTVAAGGGILNAAGTVNLANSTISNNRSTLAGGGLVSTLGILTPLLGVTNLRNTIIANNNDLLALNVLGRDVVGVLGSINSLGNNLIGSNFGAEDNFQASVFIDVTPQPNVKLDLVGGVAAGNRLIDPRLGTLQNNGGPTNTRLLFTDSPALDKGNNCVLNSSCPSNNPSPGFTLEQRGNGFPRLIGTAVDIGAAEGSANVTPIVVNSLADNENDGCGTGICTLREAINDANATSEADTINFDPGLVGTITLTAGQLVASSDLLINGPGARNLTISGNNTTRVFLIATPTSGGDITVSMNNLTIANGNAQPALIGSTLIGDGGGVLNGALLGVISGTSTLNMSRVAIDRNQATTFGGGVATRLNAVTNIYRSLVSNNTSNATLPVGGDVGGGGISNVAAMTTLLNTTVTNNTALAAGGGILNVAGTLNLADNTISHNTSTLAGGGVVSLVGVIPASLGVTYVRNTIIAKNNDLLATNIVGRDVVGVLGSINSLGNNIIGSNFGAEANFTASAFVGLTPQPNAKLDLVGGIAAGNQIVDPLLGPLQNNGGLTDTRLPLPGSPAIDKGNNCVLTNSCSTPYIAAMMTEQRGAGYPRRQGSAVDIGAVETLAPTAAGATVSGRVTQSNGKGIFRAIVTLTDRNGVVQTATTSLSGQFEFQGVEALQTYVLQVQHKQYVFNSQLITPTTDLLDLSLIGNPSGGGLSSF